MQPPPLTANHNKTQQHHCDRMIERLRLQGIQHPAVLEAMRQIPRHLFVDQALSSHAYADYALPIGQGQTISQPYIVARMTQALLDTANRLDAVLEIGTGCGYQTAVLSHIAQRVYSIERVRSLSERAQERLRELGLDHNVIFNYEDGQRGWQTFAPYQGIIVTAAPEEIPTALLEQLAIGGRLIIPVGSQRTYQHLMQIQRHKTGYDHKVLDEVNFVPLKQGIQ